MEHDYRDLKTRYIDSNETPKEMEPLTPELEIKLKKAGFTQTQFEPKQNQRFIVNLDGIPSYVVKAVTLPSYSSGWTGIMSLTLYNPVDLHLEQSVIDLKDKTHNIEVKILDPVGDVLVVWNISTTLQRVDFESLDWEDKGHPSHIFVYFDVADVEISYPKL